MPLSSIERQHIIDQFFREYPNGSIEACREYLNLHDPPPPRNGGVNSVRTE